MHHERRIPPTYESFSVLYARLENHSESSSGVLSFVLHPFGTAKNGLAEVQLLNVPHPHGKLWSKSQLYSTGQGKKKCCVGCTCFIDVAFIYILGGLVKKRGKLDHILANLAVGENPAGVHFFLLLAKSFRDTLEYSLGITSADFVVVGIFSPPRYLMRVTSLRAY